MAMATVLGFVPASISDQARVSLAATRRRRHLVVRAVGGDERFEITSMSNDKLSELAKSVFQWGRAVQQQARRFFHELADGSVLITFGPPAPPETRVKTPPRLPSRYAKKHPFTPKRSKKPEPEPVESTQQSVKKLPQRLSSAFSKQTPIIRSSPRRSRRSTTPQAPEVHHLEPEQVQGEGDVDGLLKRLNVVRPVTVFARKSPIPTAGKDGKRKRSGGVRSQLEDGLVLSEPEKQMSPPVRSKHSRPVTAFARKSPISHGESVRRKRNYPMPEVLLDCDQEPLVPKPKQEPKPRRSKGAFVRKSPINPSSRRNPRIKPVTGKFSTKVSEEEIVRIVMRAVSQTRDSQVASDDGSAEEEASETLNGSLVSQTQAIQVEVVEVVETDVEVSDDEDPGTVVDESNLSALTLRRLKRIAKSRGLKGYSRLRKAELLELLKQS